MLCEKSVKRKFHHSFYLLGGVCQCAEVEWMLLPIRAGFNGWDSVLLGAVSYLHLKKYIIKRSHDFKIIQSKNCLQGFDWYVGREECSYASFLHHRVRDIFFFAQQGSVPHPMYLKSIFCT